MQTFLPHEDFAASAKVLDSARLGKQRLEALQALRALVLPVYGWQRHPASRMWRGHLPALTLYTLTMIDEWTSRGKRDTIRPFVLEFAPEVDRLPQTAVPMPDWLGTAEFHDSHRSNLVRKLPEHYRPHFPAIADDLPYVWPIPAAPDGFDAVAWTGPPLWIIRARSAAELREWLATDVVTFPDLSPAGSRSKAWAAQAENFSALRPGEHIAVVRSDSTELPVGVVTGEASAYAGDGDAGLRLSVEFDGELHRSAFRYPVLLQDPRSLFRAPDPRE